MGYTRGTRWSDELIKEKVLEVKNALGIDRMPSRKECEAYFQDNRLACAVTKRIGWYKLAEEMGFPMKKSETQLGKECEARMADELRARGHKVERMPQNFPYDLLVNECIKVDVKASRLFKGKQGDFFTFNLEKPFSTCDVYVLCELDENNSIFMTMVVPSKFVIRNTQISVGVTNSKYHKFIDRWDYINEFSDFWNGVKVDACEFTCQRREV